MSTKFSGWLTRTIRPCDKGPHLCPGGDYVNSRKYWFFAGKPLCFCVVLLSAGKVPVQRVMTDCQTLFTLGKYCVFPVNIYSLFSIATKPAESPYKPQVMKTKQKLKTNC